jgi:GTPase
MTKQKIKAILVDVIDLQTTKEEAAIRMMELESLINTYGGIAVVSTFQRRAVPDYETYIGKGKVKEIFDLGMEEKADIVIVNNILKPRQIYELGEKFRDAEMKVWDRVDLILKIFSRHAKSTQAKLQIELASIRHMGPRIFGMGQELMQQTGATGQRGGQGETNVEMMKRHLRKQELSIQKKLKHYELIDDGHRKRRRRNNLKTIALVGYTNAGKSSLLNTLTKKEVYIADELFATLSTRVGKLYIENKYEQGTEYKPGKEILLSDTIGFIRDLPPSLIEAFKSTLAETVQSDVLMHVIDISDEDIDRKIEIVEDVLLQIGLVEKKRIYVFNKVDLIAPRSIFDKEAAKREKKGLLKAGKGTSELLGWTDNKDKDKAQKRIEELKDKYQNFNPIFISAFEKLNLETLIGELEGLI